MMNIQDRDSKETYDAFFKTCWLVGLSWVVFLIDRFSFLDLNVFGLHPREWNGVLGIFTLPFLHANASHLMSNTLSLFLLIFGLFLLYQHKAWLILVCLFLMSGLLTWIMGRVGTVHIGASGLVYALASFHFISGIIRRVPRQMAFALLVAFLYGGFIWAFFPSLYQNTSISWEGHLSGLITGIAFALYFRRLGPPKPVYPYLEDESEDIYKEMYWLIPEEDGEQMKDEDHR